MQNRFSFGRFDCISLGIYCDKTTHGVINKDRLRVFASRIMCEAKQKPLVK